MKKSIIVLIAIFCITAIFWLAYNIIPKTNPEKLACEAQEWKKWQKVWKAQIYTCVEHYSDWWESCSSSSDCSWSCIKKDIDGPAFCEYTDNRFWCGNTVENIISGEWILCID